MTNRLFAVLRYTAIVTMVASLFLVAGCDDDDAPTVFDGSVSALIASDQFKQANTGSADNALDSLVKYLALYPDLAATANGTAELTLFAPSNTAFKNLLETPGFPTKFSLISPDLIKGVIAYHIVMGKKLKADLTAKATVPTLYADAGTTTPAVITVNDDGTLFTGSSNPNIDIVVADQLASNGVVHVVESVMVPPSVGKALIPILGTMAGTVMLGKDFTLLARLVTRADAGYTEDAANGKLKVVSHLARKDETFLATRATFFAIPNAVFEAAATAASTTPTAFIDQFTAGAEGTARAILLNHYVLGRYVVSASTGAEVMHHGGVLDPLSHKTITVFVSTASPSNPYGVAISNTVDSPAESFRPIVTKDVIHTNGIIQVFGGILQ